MSDFKDLPQPDRHALGDLTDLLSSEMPSRLDWLHVDEEEYRTTLEALPRQNLDAMPELEEAWAQLGQDAPGALARVPINQGGWHPTLEAPFWSERADAPGPADQRKSLQELLLRMRTLMEGGQVGQSLLDALRSEFPSDVLERHANMLKAARARWEGRLGHLYVDADLHEDCRAPKAGRSKALTAAAASPAPYALRADKCGGCVLAQEGRCSVLNKELVHRVDLERSPLTEEDWQQVRRASPLVSSLSPDDVARVLKAHPQDVAARMRVAANLAEGKLRQARLAPAEADGSALSARVARAVEGSGLTSAQVLGALKAASAPDPLRLSAAAERERLQRFAEELLRRGSAQVLDLKLASTADPRMTVLAQEAPLFGQLYVDLSYWPTREAAAQALAAAPDAVRQVPFLIGQPGGAPQSLDFGSPVVQEVVFTRWAASQGCAPGSMPGAFRKLASEFSSKAASMTPSDWKRLALQAYEAPLPPEAREYRDLSSWRLNPQALTWGQVKAALIKAPAAPAALEDPRPRAALHQLLERMASGEHSNALRAEIDLLPAPLARQASFHFGLLGRLYLLPEVGTGIKRASSVPVKQEGQDWATFLKSAAVVQNLAKRVVAVWGPARAERILKEARGAEQILKVARQAWARPLARREWQGPVVYKEAARLLWEQAQSVDWGSAVALGKAAAARTSASSADWSIPVAGAENLRARRAALDRSAPGHEVLAGWEAGRKAPLWAALAEGVQGGKRVKDVIKVRTASSRALAQSAADPNRQGPLVTLFQKEEGLLGGAYVLASTSEDCRKAPKSRTARRVLSSARCGSCHHKQANGSCGVYGLPLVSASALRYDVKDLRVAVASAQGRGVMTPAQAARVLASARDSDGPALRSLIKAVHLWRKPAAQSAAREWQGPVLTAHVSSGGVDVPAERARLLDWARAQVSAGAYRQDVVRGVQAGWNPEVVRGVIAELRPILAAAPKAEAHLLTASSVGAETGLGDLQSFDLSVTSGADPMSEAMSEALASAERAGVTAGQVKVSLEGEQGSWGLEGLWSDTQD